MICPTRCRKCHVTYCGLFAHPAASHCHDDRQPLTPVVTHTQRHRPYISSSWVLHLELWSFSAGGRLPGGERCFSTVFNSPETDQEMMCWLYLINLLVIIEMACVQWIISESCSLVCWNPLIKSLNAILLSLLGRKSWFFHRRFAFSLTEFQIK